MVIHIMKMEMAKFSTKEKLKQLIECTLIMENCINEFNKDPLLKNISKEVDRIFAWTINPLN